MYVCVVDRYVSNVQATDMCVWVVHTESEREKERERVREQIEKVKKYMIVCFSSFTPCTSQAQNVIISSLFRLYES